MPEDRLSRLIWRVGPVVLAVLLLVMLGRLVWTLVTPLPPDPQAEACYAERAAWLEEHRREVDASHARFMQLLADHQAQMRAIQEGR
jgi:hypothetical protein